MSNPWDEEARNRLAVQRTANWFAWCDRNGFTEVNPDWYPMGRRYWSREHFKLALSVMPKSHPDRWKYETGARYAPTHYAHEHGWREIMWGVLTFIPTLIAIVLLIVYVMSGYIIHAIIVLIAVSLPWTVYMLIRYFALRR